MGQGRDTEIQEGRQAVGRTDRHDEAISRYRQFCELS